MLKAMAPARVLIAVGLMAMLFLGFVLAVTGRLGFANIEADEVGVKVNYITGTQEVITQAGFQLYIPFIEDVFRFDQTPEEFKMEGANYRGHNHVPFLTVRASDGSNFQINDLTIIYKIIPGAADLVLSDSGPGLGFKQEWIKAYARSILRDEFGRYTAVEVANPTIYKRAPTDAARRMNELLEPHGIRIERINTPNPSFDLEYEKAIEDRKEADQEVERLIAESERLEQLREQRLAAVAKEKEVEKQRLTGDLRKAVLAAEERKIEVTKSADVYATKKVADGQAEQAELVNRARGLEAKYSKEAEGIESRALALEERGKVVVREAIIQKLAQIQFTLLPYSRDAEPKRLEHIDLRDAAIQGQGQEQE